MSKRVSFEVPENYGEVRVDRFVKECTGVTHAAICKFLKFGKVWLNGKRCKKCGEKVKSGDRVELVDVEFDNVAEGDDSSLREAALQSKLKELKASIIFENEKILVINKPYGIPSQSGSKVGISLDLLMKYISPSARIVHRLDKETSGIMVFAKTREIAQIMFNGFKDKSIKKTYIACVKGLVEHDSGVVKTFITKSSKDRHSYVVSDNEGKVAITEYDVLKRDVQRGLTLLHLFPKTGRTHQLRVHCAQVFGCPIIGDNRYSENKKKTKLNLFAAAISLPKLVHPVDVKLNKIPDYFLIKG